MYRMAQQQLQDADAERPGFRHSDFLITLGWAECRVGRWKEALQSFCRAEPSDYMRLWDYYGLTLGKAVALHHTGEQEESLRQLVLAQRKLQQDKVEAFRFFFRRSLLEQALAICRPDQSDTLVYVDGIIQPEDNGILDLDPAKRSVAVNVSQSCFQISLLTAPVEVDDKPQVHLAPFLTRGRQTLPSRDRLRRRYRSGRRNTNDPARGQ